MRLASAFGGEIGSTNRPFRDQNFENPLTTFPPLVLIFNTLNRTWDKISTTSIVDNINAGTYCLAQWPALPNRNCVSFINTESRRDVCGKVLVPLLVSGVLGNEMKILATDNESTVHLG